MLIAIILYLIMGVIGVYLARTDLNCIIASYRGTQDYSTLGVILCYAIWIIIAPVCILYGLCKSIFNKKTKRES